VAKPDHMLVGVVVAFDAETGDVFHIHQKIVETTDGKPAFSPEITTEEREKIRADAARDNPRRRVDVMVAPPEMAPSQGELVSYHVDPMTRKLRKLKIREPSEGLR
jgi:hypothetical protein